MAPKDDTSPDEAAAPETPAAPLTTLVGAAYPTVSVHANASVRGLIAGFDGELPEDAETQALIASGFLTRV